MLLLFAFKCCSLIYPNYTLINNSVFDNKFIEKNITKDSYLFISDKMDQKNHKISRIIQQNKRNLGFITPWNDVGYNLTLDYCNKFSDIVPVWFRIEYEQGNFVLKGDDVINEKWINEIKIKCNNIKIVPRLLFDFRQDLFINQFKKLINLMKISLKQILNKYNFDGIFIECPALFVSRQSINHVVNLVKEIRKIKKNILMIVLMII